MCPTITYRTNTLKPVRTAVFPVAGFGTRMLPATKAVPKELLPIVDRPAIQYVVDEAREAGIEHFVFVTSRGKHAIEDYFDHHFELEASLSAKDNSEAVQQLHDNRIGCGQASFTRQQQPLGLGHAIGCARRLVGDEPFAVLLPDMVMRSQPGCLKQLVQVYEEQGGGNVVALERMPTSDLHKYGVANILYRVDGAPRITGMVEKPKPGQAPSNLVNSGRYILQPEIFDCLDKTPPGTGGEIQLTDAMVQLLKQQPFWGMVFKGDTFDVGSKLGYLCANVAYGSSHPEIGGLFRHEIANVLRKFNRKMSPTAA